MGVGIVLLSLMMGLLGREAICNDRRPGASAGDEGSGGEHAVRVLGLWLGLSVVVVSLPYRTRTRGRRTLRSQTHTALVIAPEKAVIRFRDWSPSANGCRRERIAIRYASDIVSGHNR